MVIEGFDYKEFVKELSSQTEDFLPADFQDFQKEYVKNTIMDISLRIGEAVYNDEKSNFSIDQGKIITQLVAEWVFHKSIDTIKAKIPYDCWDEILNKIAFTILTVATQEYARRMPTNLLIQVAEQVVGETYQSILVDLRRKNIISVAVLYDALNQSSIDDFSDKLGN